ncbi:MAG: dipeptide epimerase [Chloroflexi bacterium]|nr:dipeptide epimerase [Chloroflexota bacterium]
MNLTTTVISLRLDQPFVSNKGSTTAVQQVVIELTWQEYGGFGTVLCPKENNLSVEQILQLLRACEPLLNTATPWQFELYRGQLASVVRNQAAIMAGIDMAWHDLLGKVVAQPIHALWGLAGLSIPPTALSLGVQSEHALVEQAATLAAWPILKLKLTNASNLDSLRQIREVYAGRIWVDGNGAWDVDQAIAAVQQCHAYGVELIEQPIPAGNLDQLCTIRQHSPIPLVADEDCRGLDDVWRLQSCVDVINLKLFKCGGLRQARTMIDVAKQLGLKVMLGCKTESSLGISAIAQLAGLADYLDLDGHLDLVNDPFQGLVIEQGRLRLPQTPGLGLTIQGAIA